MNILIIEKKARDRELLLKLLKEKKGQIFAAIDAKSALTYLQSHSFDLIFSDLQGVQLLDQFKQRPEKVPLIFLAETVSSPFSNVQAILHKPFEQRELEEIFQRLSKRQILLPTVIAKSPQMREVLRQLEKIAKSHSNVFISGESGTGKEVIASSIHALSKRAVAPFIKVNCAAFPDTLIESEFFGHEKGAFTGAHSRREGRFERADKGTLLLDEVTEIPPSLQAKLLRVVQEMQFERLGGSEAIQIDVRLISTSNREMTEAIDHKQFRSDLYYRLGVLPLHLPPLRERKEDILPLAGYFLEEIMGRDHIMKKIFSEEAEKTLLEYPWPGNIRELKNVIEHCLIMHEGEIIAKEDLHFQKKLLLKRDKPSPLQGKTLKEVEKLCIEEMLKTHHFNKSKAAAALGISVKALGHKLES